MIRTVRRLESAALLGALAMCLSGVAHAQVYKFDLPAQPLESSLRAIGQQASVNILFDSDLVEGLSAPALNAELTVEEAIRRLTAEKTLTIQRPSEGTITVSPAKDSPKRISMRDGGVASPPAERSRKEASVQRSSNDSSSNGSSSNDIGDSPDRHVLAEIVVTAQKREERLIDVPQSVSVLSAEDLTSIGAVQFRDYADTIPGMAYNSTGAGYTQVVLRGVTTGYETSSPVAIYVDEVPLGASGVFSNSTRMALDAALFDLERIEVLRGPQGTLYGAGSVGGLVKYVTKQPSTKEFEGVTQAGLSSTEHGGMSYNAAGAVNIPLSQDKAALRVSGFYSHDGGYVDNATLGRRDVNRSNVYGGRADVLLTPTDELKVRIAAFAQNITRDGEGTSDYDVDGRPLVNSLTSVRHIEEPFEQQLRTISATLNYDFAGAQLTSISSYEDRNSVYQIDATPLLLPFLTGLGSFSGVGNGNSNETGKFVQELRLSGQGQLLDWVVGGYYTTEDNETGSYYVLRDLAGQPAPNNVSTVLDTYDFDEYAAFGTLTWHITDKLDASGGIRYSKNHQRYEQNGVGPFSVSAPRVHSSGNATTYLANVSYSIADQSMIYARYATGYRPGGPNSNSRDLVTGQVLAPADFDADTLDSYEIGYKGETPDRRWAVDVAAYYIDWDNIVIRVYNATTNVSYYDNAAGMKVKGAELALTSRPIEGLSIVGSYTYTDSYLTEANTDLGAAKGERMPTVPRYTANLSADYTFDSSWLPTIGASFRHVDERHASFDGNLSFPQYILPSYSSLDVRAGMDINQYNVRLYVRNVLDERGELSAYTWQGNPRPALLQPRTVGLTVTTRF